MTEKPKHTPGPWYYKAGINQMCSDDSTICEVIAKKPVVEISTGTDKKYYIFSPVDTVCSTEANARLIAAAPDLLAALEDILQMHYADSELCADNEWKAVEAAIKKAKGE